MKHSENDRYFGRSKSGIFAVFIFTILCAITSASTSFALEPQTGGADETRKSIKQAGKLARAGLLNDAEAMLRRVIENDKRSSAAKVELAFVLTKQRKLGEAYSLVFPVAEAEPKNSRAYAVLGMVLLTAGRFVDARLIFYNSLKVNRQEDLAWAGVGLVDFYENRITQSLANLQEAVFHNAGEPDYLFALAQVSSRAERYRDAADAYFRFLSVSKDTDKDRRERIKGLISFLRFLGQKDGLYNSIGNESSNVNFELVGNRPVITLHINRRSEPLRFVLDTGSGITVISDKTAKLLKVNAITRGGYAKGIGGDGRFEIIYGYLQQVDIGDVKVRNVPVYIREFHDKAQKVDGYLGLAMISKFLTTIDYGSKTFSLTKKDTDTRDFREKATISLPLRLTSSGFLSGQVQLEGIESPLNFIVDTGASVSVISDRVANTKEIMPYLSEEKLRVIGAAGITEGVPSFLLPRVSFGSHSRKLIEAIALDLDLINEASGFEQSGILGGNFLKNYSLTFDFKNSKVTFTSVTPEN